MGNEDTALKVFWSEWLTLRFYSVSRVCSRHCLWNGRRKTWYKKIIMTKTIKRIATSRLCIKSDVRELEKSNVETMGTEDMKGSERKKPAGD